MEALQARIERALNGDSVFCVVGIRFERIPMNVVNVTDVLIDGGKECSLGEGDLVNLEEAMAVCGILKPGKLDHLKQQFTTNGEIDPDKVAEYMDVGELDAQIEAIRKKIEKWTALEAYAAVRAKERAQWVKETMTQMSYAEARRLRSLDAFMQRIKKAVSELGALVEEYDEVQVDDE